MSTVNKPAKRRIRVSIVIPAYNEARHIAACLDAIAAQTDTADEVIVVDNNSTDETAKIVRRYPFVTLLHAKDAGVVYARNIGFNAATGDIIGRIDADTRLAPDWVRTIRQFYADDAHPRAAVTGGVLCYNLRMPRAVAAVQNYIVFRINWLLFGHYILFGSNMAIPANLWREVRGITCTQTNIHEDLDLSLHLHRLGYEIAYRPHIVVGAKMRRVRDDHGALWDNLRWWPNTLRYHHIHSWPFALLGAAFLWTGSPIFTVNERIARAFGRAPMPID